MQQFPCPWCGSRAEIEFRYAGVDDKTWAQYLHFRRNAKGPAKELWIHIGGCGRWFVLSRDTVTHAVDRSEPLA